MGHEDPDFLKGPGVEEEVDPLARGESTRFVDLVDPGLTPAESRGVAAGLELVERVFVHGASRGRRSAERYGRQDVTETGQEVYGGLRRGVNRRLTRRRGGRVDGPRDEPYSPWLPIRADVFRPAGRG